MVLLPGTRVIVKKLLGIHLHLEGSVHYPSAIGGAKLGRAVDASRNILIVNTMNLSSTIVMVPRKDCDKALKELARDSVQSRFSALQQNAPYCTIRAYGFMSPLGVPCTKPPWGNENW